MVDLKSDPILLQVPAIEFTLLKKCIQSKIGFGTPLPSLTCYNSTLFFFSPGSLELSRLTTSEDTPWINASEILLGSCVDLFEKGLISTALELVAGLGSFHESSRYVVQGLT